LRNRLFGQSPFNPFEVISKDGFTMQLEVRLVFRVKPEDAPFMVAKIGGMELRVEAASERRCC
jgi:hypothetical protein